ncbi:MAG TPA: acyltransferase [Phycisphaerae bacterium]|nr:acyltransferase [Phycisphaerae bacterium]
MEWRGGGMKAFDWLYNRIALARHGVRCEAFPEINGRILIAKFADGGTIRIGRDVIINSCFRANPVGGHRTVLLIKGKDALIEIDDGAGMSNVLIAARTHIYIGKNAMLGAGCKIFDTDFHSIRYAERAADVNIPTAPVRIGDRAFIGGDALILKGVTVGEESVIGAGSVVAKDVPPGEIWAGNPARFIRKLQPG